MKYIKSYLDTLENFVLPQLEGLQPHVFLQQDGALPDWGIIVHSSLNNFSQKDSLGEVAQFFGYLDRPDHDIMGPQDFRYFGAPPSQ